MLPSLPPLHLTSDLEYKTEITNGSSRNFVFVKDLQPNGNGHNMLHCYITTKLLEIPDLSFKGYKIWYDATQKLYPFGYPHAFVANQFHQFVMIFRKEK